MQFLPLTDNRSAEAAPTYSVSDKNHTSSTTAAKKSGSKPLQHDSVSTTELANGIAERQKHFLSQVTESDREGRTDSDTVASHSGSTPKASASKGKASDADVDSSKQNGKSSSSHSESMQSDKQHSTQKSDSAKDSKDSKDSIQGERSEPVEQQSDATKPPAVSELKAQFDAATKEASRLFKDKQFSEAAARYTAALELCDSIPGYANRRAALYNNRSAMCLSLASLYTHDVLYLTSAYLCKVGSIQHLCLRMFRM
jgi:hypothetical protein